MTWNGLCDWHRMYPPVGAKCNNAARHCRYTGGGHGYFCDEHVDGVDAYMREVYKR